MLKQAENTVASRNVNWNDSTEAQKNELMHEQAIQDALKTLQVD